jgi:cell division protein ZapA (FtsZ GTPase activity inhibitor)
MKEQFISIVIADRPYRLKVKSTEEEMFLREAGKMLKDKMAQYAEAYAFKDNQDLLAMVSLYFATDNLSIKDKTEKLAIVEKELAHLEEVVDNCLENN